MLFKYKGIKINGENEKGEIDASDRISATTQLKEKNLTVVYIKEVKGLGRFSFQAINESITRIKISDKIFFTRNLSAMIAAGLPLSRAMNILSRQTKNKKFKRIIISIEENITKGKSLSDSMKENPSVFSSLFVSMVKAGEESGGLVEALKTIGEQLNNSYRLKRKIRGALMYPAIIFIAMIIIGILMLIFVVPTLTSTFQELGVELPITTRSIIFVSDLFINNTIALLSFLFVVIILLIMGAKTKRGKRITDFLFLKTPVISKLIKELNSARTTRTLSSLLSSGVDVVESIKITRDVIQNSYFKEVLEKAGEAIQKGVPLSKIMLEDEKLYPLLVGEMIEVGEETGNLSEMLLQVATFYEEEVETATKDMSTIIEPILMVVVGVVVGFFAVSMISPTYSLMSGI